MLLASLNFRIGSRAGKGMNDNEMTDDVEGSLNICWFMGFV